MSHTYKITSPLVISDAQEIVKAVFPTWNGEPVSSDPCMVLVTFPAPKTPADLGPLVKVEEVTTTA